MNTALSAVGYARQPDKATAADEPRYWHGVEGGKLIPLSIEQSEDEITTGLAAGTGEFRESIAAGADFTARAWPKSIGLALLAILGNVQSSGGPAYAHVFTLGDSVPYFTLFGKLDTELRKVAACKLDELAFSWDGNKPLKVNQTWAGCTPTFPATITPVVTEALDPYFTPLGGTFQYDVDGSTLAAAKLLGGTITFKRPVAGDIISGTVVPDDVHEAALKAEIELKVRAASLADQRAILTGTPTGTTPSGTVVYGSFSTAFVLGTNSLTFAGSRVAFQAEDPEADPKGGPVELVLKGGLYIPSGGSTPITTTLVNGVAEYPAELAS